MLKTVVLSLLCLSAPLLIGEANAARYNVIKIIEGSGTTVPEAGGINQKGQVGGSIDVAGNTQFWLWSDEVRQDLPFGNGRSGLATALNNLGQVAGTYLTGEFFVDSWGDISPVYHAFVRNSSGVLQDLGTLGGWVSFGLWINDQGVVLGAADTADNDRVPFIAQNGQMRSLQSLISNPFGWKLALETHYVAADGRIWGLGTYGGKEHIYEMTPQGDGMYRIRGRGILEGLTIRVYGFNEYGQAVGYKFASDGVGAFLWDERGMILLGYPDKQGSYAYAVNNFGRAVGMYDAEGFKAFLWENGVIFDLNNLIPPDSGLVLTKANAINDAGSILCTYRDVASGFYGVCLLVPTTPVPLEISHGGLTQAGLRLEVRGGAGQPLAVEYTTDWAQWTTLATSTNLFGKRTFIDPDAASASFRAYRARLLAP